MHRRVSVVIGPKGRTGCTSRHSGSAADCGSIERAV